MQILNINTIFLKIHKFYLIITFYNTNLLNHFNTAILYLFEFGPEIALSSESLITANDLRFDISFFFAPSLLLGTFKPYFDLLFSQIGKCLKAASRANTRSQCGHFFLISYLRSCYSDSSQDSKFLFYRFIYCFR